MWKNNNKLGKRSSALFVIKRPVTVVATLSWVLVKRSLCRDRLACGLNSKAKCPHHIPKMPKIPVTVKSSLMSLWPHQGFPKEKVVCNSNQKERNAMS